MEGGGGVKFDPLLTTDDNAPKQTAKHLQTYTAGEDGGRLANLAKELGLQQEQARLPRRQVRRQRSYSTTPSEVLHLLLDSSTEEARMKSIYSSFGLDDTDDLEEDPHASGLGGNLTSAVLGIIKGMVGPAILYLPHGFASAGYGIAIPTMLCATIMFLYSSSCLLEAWKMESSNNVETLPILDGRKKRKMLSYPELAYRALGPTGESIVKTGIALMQSGVCLTYLIFVPQNLNASMRTFGLDISASAWLILMVALQIPLSWIRDIRKLTPTNLLANLLILYGLCVCLGFSFSESVQGPEKNQPVRNLLEHILSLKFYESGWFLFIGTSVLLFEGSITLLVPLQESVESEEQRAQFPQVYQTVILGIMSFYAIFGISCWMAFGDEIRTVFTTSLPSGILATTVQLAYSIAVVFTFPLQNFPALEISTRTLLSKFGGYKPEPGILTRRNVVSSCLVLLLALIAVLAMDSLDKVVSLMGSLLGCPIAFVFPPLIHSALDLTISERRLFWNRVVAGLGVGAMVLASITTIVTW